MNKLKEFWKKLDKITLGVLVLVTAILIGAGIMFSMGLDKDENSSSNSVIDGEASTLVVKIGDRYDKLLRFEEGEVLNVILEREYTIEYNQWEMMSGINDYKEVEGYYIAFYINDEYAMEGIKTYTPANLDVIGFVLTKIEW